MRGFDKFKWKMNLNGGSLRDENIKSSIELLKETFVDDASLAAGIYLWELGLNDYEGKEPLTVRIYKRTFSNANGVTMKFQTMIDSPVIVGDVLYDSIADEYLICTESFNIDGIHWQGKLTLCNWILRWQDKNGDILEYPCHDINATQYNSGEQSNEQFTIGSSQHMVTLTCDKNTIALKTPQRFFLDKNTESPTSFIVTQNDSTSYSYGSKGLVKVTLMECATNNDTDRLDLGICDYVDKDDAKNNNDSNALTFKSVISYTSTVIKSGGDAQTFVGNFFDTNGTEVTSISPMWDIVCDFKDALVINEEDNCITIGIDDDRYVDEEFKLNFSATNGGFPSSVIVSIESLL